MKILAIDTSCDDTSISIISAKNSKFKILSNVVSSQIKIHKKYGGVYPMLARREHEKNLVPVLKKALLEAKLLRKKRNFNKKNDLKNLDLFLKREGYLLESIKKFFKEYDAPEIDIISITQGPGLEPCLWTGINFAKTLAFFWKKPIVAANHLEGHIFSNWVEAKKEIKMPAVCLIVSGGHTELVLMKKVKNYKLLGETLDDAAGECLDKIAKTIGLSYPGGPEIEKIAKNGNPEKYTLPRPMFYTKDYNFSFSGLKTAVLYLTKKMKPGKMKKNEVKRDLAASSQKAVIDVLIHKTIRAAKDKKVKIIILGGGVASNTSLKKHFLSKIKKEKLSMFFLSPPKKLCTDNAAMIAIAGYFNRNNKIKPENIYKLKASSNLNF